MGFRRASLSCDASPRHCPARIRRAARALLGALLATTVPWAAAATPARAASWTPWTTIGSGMHGGADATSDGAGRRDVFVRSATARLSHATYSSSWSGWEDLGGPVASDPAAVSWGRGRLDVFVRGTDGAVYQRTYSSGWHDWQRVGGATVGSPDVTSQESGSLDLVVRGTNNILYRKAYAAGSWGSWQRLGGPVTSDPAITSWEPGRLDVFVRAGAASMWHKAYAHGSWSHWQNNGGALAAGVDATSDGPGRLDAVTVGTDHALWRKSWRGHWSSWKQVGGSTRVNPSVTSPAPGQLAVFLTDSGSDVRTSERGTPAPSGSPRQIGRAMLAAYGWDNDKQWTCLDKLWTRESNWNPTAENPSSGAYGIPQALPGKKMASAGADWRTNPATQIRWGLGYIHDRYATPCKAWAHSETYGWYVAP